MKLKTFYIEKRTSLISLLKSNKSLIFVLAVAVIVQLAFFSLLIWRFGAASDGFIIGGGDPVKYLKLAQNLLKLKSFVLYTTPIYILESYIPPFYPLFLALFLKLLGQFWAVILWQQIIFSLPTIVIIWKIFEKVFDKRTAFWGALLVAVDTQRIMVVNQFSAESLFLFLFFLFIYFLMSFVKQAEVGTHATSIINKNLFFAGVFLGLAALTRSFVLALTPMTAIYLVFLCWRKVITGKQLLKFSAIFIGVVVLVISPWMARNYYHFKVFKLSSSFEYILYTRHVKRIQEYKLKQAGVDARDLDQVVSEVRLLEFKRDNKLEHLSDADADLMLWDARYANYEFRKASQFIKKNFGTYLNVWAHRAPGWLLDNDLGIQLAFVQKYFYPVVDKWRLEPYQALGIGRVAFLAMYLTIISVFLKQRRLFAERLNSMVFLILLYGSFVFVAAMVYTPRHKLPLDFITYGAFIFVILQFAAGRKKKSLSPAL